MTTITPKTVPADMLALAGDAFVTEAVRRLKLTHINAREQHALAQTIYRGVNKSRIWEALLARSENRPSEAAPTMLTALTRPDDEVAIEEVLTEHAKEDDSIFIEYAYFRLAGRDPELSERMRLQAALIAGELDRHEVLLEIIQAARAEDRNPFVATMAGDQPFSLVSAERTERQFLVKRLSPSEYLIAEGGLHQAKLTKEGLELFGGLALSGPKRPLKQGVWRLKLDWSQHEDAAIVVEVTANAGAEKLMKVELAGTALCTLEFRIMPEHLISEVLIYGTRRGGGEAWIVRPREVSLSWVGA